MAGTARGRSIVLVLGGVMLLLCLWATASWRTLTVRYHAWRASEDVGTLLGYSRQPASSWQQLGAIFEMERSAKAREALLRDYLARGLSEIALLGPGETPLAEQFASIALHEKGLSILHREVEGPAGHRLYSYPGSSSPSPSPSRLTRQGPPVEPPRRLPGLLEALPGPVLRLESFPDMAIHVVAGQDGFTIRLESDMLLPVPEVLVRALEHPRAQVRAYAASKLASISRSSWKAAEAATALVTVLRDEAPAVRSAAVDALARLDAAGEPHLIAELGRGDSLVRGQILERFTLEPTLQALPALLELLDEPEESLDSGALVALERAAARLGTSVRGRIAWALADRLAVPGGSPRFRPRACRTLAALDPAGEVALPRLLETTNDADPAVAAAAIDALGDLGQVANPAARRVAAALASAEAHVRLAAARALPRLALEPAADLAAAVAPLLLHQDAEIALAALTALHGMDAAAPGSCQGLLRALELAPLSEKSHAVRLLGLLTDDCEAALAALEAAREHPVLASGAEAALERRRALKLRE